MKKMKFILIVLLLSAQMCFSKNLESAICPLNIDFFKRFNDSYFEKYIFEALENNHSLKQADYKSEQYRAQVSSQFSQELPRLSVSSNYLGAHFPKGDPNFLLKRNSYILPFKASYEPDLLLKNRDKTKSAKKLYQAQLANQKQAYISLLTDVANAYINILLFDYLIDKQIEIINDKTQNADFTKNKYNFGVISFIDLNDVWAELNTQKMVYESLIKQQKSTLYNFAKLLGKSAYDSENIERGKLSDFEYQETIPDIINSDLIYERPDLIEIENKLKSAKIDVTVAKKEFFPNFNITGFLVFDTAGMGNFFSWNSSFAYILAGLTQDIFAGGAKIANLKIKKARFNELMEEYQEADLNAIKEINNALNMILQDTLSEKHSIKQLEYENRNFIASKRKLKQGTISKIEYLQNKNALNQREQLSANAKATRIMDYFTLYKALGGQL